MVYFSTNEFLFAEQINNRYLHLMRAQRSFTGPGFKKQSDSFGGSLLKGNPKGKRPLHSKFPIHLTLRAKRSVLRTPTLFGRVNKTIAQVSAKHGVKIYNQANVGNHLHFAIKLPHVRRWAAFIRELTGRIALICRTEGGLWLYRPHTRIIRGWRKAFRTLKEYIELNQLEADGTIDRRHITNLRDLRRQYQPL